MASAQLETFTYKPLDTKVDSIRLLRLKEGPETDDIECELIRVTFASKPKYEALSYTWGSPDALHTIAINGCKFVVRENLYWALRNLRRVMEQPLYWIDAICINQDDVEERNRQVSLMAFIYSRAYHVLVWLGRPATEGNINRYASGYPMDLIYKWLSQRDYWNRVWIVQEVCHAKNIQCIYELGDNQTMVEGWEVIATKIMVGAPGHAKAPLRLYRQREGRHGDSNTLERLLETFSDAKCTDLRDKIYAFLGLSHDGQDSNLTVDYSRSLYELYLDVIQFHHLSEPQSGGSIYPNVDREMRIVAFSTLLQQILEGGVEAENQKIGHIKPSGYHIGRVETRALIEGRILHLGPPYSEVVSSARADQFWKSMFRKYYSSPQDLARLRKQDEAYTTALLDMGEADLARVSEILSPDYLVSISESQWLPRGAYSEGAIRGSESWGFDDPRWGEEHKVLDGDSMTESATSAVKEPRRFLGSNTCMGLVQPSAQVGDFICRFWGCNIAALLRPNPEGNFHLVGRADMATTWVETENPTPINFTSQFEGWGVVVFEIEIHNLQKLTR